MIPPVPSETELDDRTLRHRNMNLRLTCIVGLMLIVASACGGGPQSSPTLAPSPGPTTGRALTGPDLKVAIVDTYGPLWYCDPDFYPIQRQDETDSARERWAEVIADADAFESLTARLGLDPAGAFTDAQKLAVYQPWKVLQAIALDPIGNDTYRFDYLAQPKAGAAEGTRTGGTITSSGAIDIEQQAAATEPICPICLSRGTRIETPTGGIAVEDLRIGDPIWTLDVAGDRIEGTVIAVGSTVAPVNHRVVHLVLADGRSVTASPGHPLADGRLIGQLRSGEVVDGSVVVTADLLSYLGGHTYDMVVSGPTGTYFVDGIPLGSTLRP